MKINSIAIAAVVSLILIQISLFFMGVGVGKNYASQYLSYDVCSKSVNAQESHIQMFKDLYQSKIESGMESGTYRLGVIYGTQKHINSCFN